MTIEDLIKKLTDLAADRQDRVLIETDETVEDIKDIYLSKNGATRHVVIKI